MKILLVEDDPEQLEPLHAILSRSGHVVDGAENGAIAQQLIAERKYDLLILDWLLPEVSGIELCRAYRQAGKTSPVLMLTAKDAIADKVAGLDSGADDYLVKPINGLELLARVRALGRRSPLWQGERLILTDLELHLDTLTLQRQGQTVGLSGREFQFFEYVMRHPRQVLSRDQLEQALWEWHTPPESKAVATLVHRVRQRLQAVGAADWLQTVYGMGYKLEPPD